MGLDLWAWECGVGKRKFQVQKQCEPRHGGGNYNVSIFLTLWAIPLYTHSLLSFLGKKPQSSWVRTVHCVESRFAVEIGQDCRLIFPGVSWACFDHSFGLYQPRPVGRHFQTLKSYLLLPVSSLRQIFPRKSRSSFPFRFSNHNQICKANHQAKQQAVPDHSGEQGTKKESEGEGDTGMA